MKFFHLADLHLGKSIHGFSMIEMGDQPFWINRLLQKAEELKPDAILISGDVYDRAVPSKEAVQLFDDFLTAVSEKGIPVLIIAGNHDSGSRLAFADRLLCHQGIYIAGELTEEAKCVTLEDAYGPIHFWMVPYLFPAAVNELLGRDDLKDYESAMEAFLKMQRIDRTERNILLAHQFAVAGGEKPKMGGSETTVGGIGQMDVHIFDDFDYTALGHIHNLQKMGKETVRYAGSPLTYHFSEIGQQKGLTVVELQEKGNIRVHIEEMPVLHPMCEISGTLEEILNTQPQPGCYIRAVLKQEMLPPQTVEILRSHFEKENCILMEVSREFSIGRRSRGENEKRDLQMRSIEELFTEFYSYLHEGDLPDETMERLITFTAEQTRNQGMDESETERKEATRQLIGYVQKCQEEST